jgi:small subunit ribosomal protein S17
MSKNVMQGVVTSDKAAKTRRVEIPRLVRDPKYGKYVRRRTICYVHDENNESALGDTVEIVESRPRSKMKRWELVRVITKGRSLDVAALRAARESRKHEQAETSDAAGDS